MISRVYDQLALESSLKDSFGVDIEVAQPIVYRVPVSHTAEATVFLTTKKQLFLYIHNPSKLLMSDIKKIVSKMGIKADLYVPPKGRPNYFEEIATSKFHEVFPGRKHVSDEDLIYYRTLVPYNPALVLIREIINGDIYQFDSDAATNWRVAAKFTYRRIRTS